jgi:hypothetical protein
LNGENVNPAASWERMSAIGRTARLAKADGEKLVFTEFFLGMIKDVEQSQTTFWSLQATVVGQRFSDLLSVANRWP